MPCCRTHQWLKMRGDWEEEDEKSGREGEKKKPDGNDSHIASQKSLKKRRKVAPPFL